MSAVTDQVDQRDPRDLRLHRPVLREVPYVPTDQPVVAAMLRLAGVERADVLYDLGCGDGRIVIHAAKHYGCRGVGVDVDPLRVIESRENAKKACVGHLVRFVQASLYDVDVRPATVVALYLLPSTNAKLRPKLLNELRPGARIVANQFPISDWPPDERLDAHHRHLYRWVVPAPVRGTWRATVLRPQGRQRFVLELQRQYQLVSGQALVGRRRPPITEGRMSGEVLRFRLTDWDRGGVAVYYEGTVGLDGTMRGVCHDNGAPDVGALTNAAAWCAVRV
jgi:precorrin-6B methylase 2